ncbi:MAG: helix-turn-helix domain-containing protein [Sedimentisphaerales bacterium]|nr:helix-turn-helix domain-containing protein [Sedimentisphaerales bacterium]
MPKALLRRTDLPPGSKLVLVELMDRVGSNGSAWPGIRRLATECGLAHSTVVEAITRLEHAGFIAVEHVSGNPARKTNRYRIICERTQNEYVPEIRAYRKPTTGRTENRPPDVPISGTEPDPCIQTNVFRLSCASDEVCRIYDAYPRRVGRAKALQAIEKALQKIGDRGQVDPHAWLLGRVKAFAASPAGRAGQYTPHPTTWFNQDRFDDDDTEWRRRTTTSKTIESLPYDIPEDCR